MLMGEPSQNFPKQQLTNWEKMAVCHLIYSVFQAGSLWIHELWFKKWGELPPRLEDNDVQGFPNEELSKFKILDTIYVLWSVLKTHD